MFIDNKKALKNFCLRTKKLFGCRVVHQVLIEFIKSYKISLSSKYLNN